MSIKDWFIKRKYRKLQDYFRKVDPHELQKDGEERVLDAFHFAAKNVPAYQRILSEHDVNPKRIHTLTDFQDHVPIITKKDLFVDSDLKDICVGGKYKTPANFYMSSGYSGNYSYGIDDPVSYKNSALYSEFLLDSVFKVFQKKTLVLNCHLGGIHIPTRSLSVAEMTTDPKATLALLDKIHKDFDQFIVMADPKFIKDLVDYGVCTGFDWKRQIVHFVSGGEFISEGLRSYIASVMGFDFNNPDEGMFYLNFGTTEVCLTMFGENIDAVRIRRAAEHNPRLRRDLFGDLTGSIFTPEILFYFPQNIFVETVYIDGFSQLVVSSVNKHKNVPIIRYRTGDWVRKMSYTTLCNILSRHGYSNLRPEFHLPVGLIWDRRRITDKWK